MEVEKLLNVLYDIGHDESEGGLSTALSNVISSLTNANVNPSETAFKALEDSIDTLKRIFEEDYTNTYPPSDASVLSAIDATRFVGNTGWNYVDSLITNNKLSATQLINKLNEYSIKRTEFIKRAETLKSNLKNFGFTPKIYTKSEIYLVGVLFPHSFAEIPLLEKQLHRWNIVLKHLNELTGGDTADAKIDYVSTGSLEFFFDQGPKTALALGKILIGVVDIYKKVMTLRQTREKLKEFNIPATEDKAIKAHEKTLVDQHIKTLVRDVVRTYKDGDLVEERIKELEVAVTKDSYFIAKAIDKGITIEIKPPELKEPDPSQEPDDTSTEEKEKVKKIHVEREQRIEQVRTAGAVLKEFSEIGNNILQLTTNETGKVDEKNRDQGEETVDPFGDSSDSLLA